MSLCIERINGRYVAFFGGVCSAVGLFASAHCQQLWQLYLTYGVITGKIITCKSCLVATWIGLSLNISIFPCIL